MAGAGLTNTRSCWPRRKRRSSVRLHHRRFLASCASSPGQVLRHFSLLNEAFPHEGAPSKNENCVYWGRKRIGLHVKSRYQKESLEDNPHICLLLSDTRPHFYKEEKLIEVNVKRLFCALSGRRAIYRKVKRHLMMVFKGSSTPLVAITVGTP